MVPPPSAQQQRSQTAADALLLVTRPTKKNNAVGTSRTTTSVSNPYNRTNSMAPNKKTKKRPLHNVNRVASGVGGAGSSSSSLVAQNITSKNNHNRLLHAPSSASSAFQRRNARDRGSNNLPPPPTGTDKALVAMLDGPSKKQKAQKKKKKGMMMLGKDNSSTSYKRSINVSSQSDATETASRTKQQEVKRPKIASSSSCIAMKPPPMPSYSFHKTSYNTTNSKTTTSSVKPRKRVSSHMNKISTSISNGKESNWMSERKAVIGDAFADSFGGIEEGNNRDNGALYLKRQASNGDNDDATNENNDHDFIAVQSSAALNHNMNEDVQYSNHDDIRVSNSYDQVSTTLGNSQLNAMNEDATNNDNDMVALQEGETSIDGGMLQVSEKKKLASDGIANTETSDSLEELLVGDSTNNNNTEEQNDIDFALGKNKSSRREYADWYDAQEHAEMDKKAELNAKKMEETKEETKRRKKQSSSHGINDNFVRLDLKNSAGSCRGARNLKKVNKQKLWRAQHRFGMNDPDGNNDSGDETNPSFMGNRQNGKRSSKRDGGDVKCFSSASNAGVDPLDDFMDGVFTKKKTSNEKKTSTHPRQPSKRDNDVPMCTRHQRPCKLLTVKKNNKGNKGRKFYVCSMPKGEQCDFFKWEEDTIEATQRALLKSSSSSGFIARQVAASKTRFKELTVPELRSEAKKRGLKATGTKDQILTRLLIWVRDEIAESVEDDDPDDSTSATTAADEAPATTAADDDDDDDSACTGESDDEIEVVAASKTSNVVSKMIELSDDDDEESSSDDDELEVCHACDEEPVSDEKRGIKYDPRSSTLRDSLKHYFGYSSFREGQEWAIDRCLSHKRSLLVAPTGQGKSMCYALPAAISDGLCLVVSPLISLMQDQLRQLPPKIPAATLSGSITSAQMALIVDDILRGRLKVLFVSPERLASAAFRRLLRPKFNPDTRQYERHFPEVSLLCVDEAHCLSQWGHNFRPSYLRVRSLLSLIEPKSVLALTATAGPMVVRDICNTLCIPCDGQGTNQVIPSSLETVNNGIGVKVLNCNRDNIDVFSIVLQDHDERRYLLHKLLKDKKSDDPERRQPKKKLPIDEGCLSKGSVIVYVWRQKDTEIVAEQLNGAGVLGGVVCYHGGMNANDRSKAQSKFLRGKARICVATVAFGLGINKPDIEGVIHLCLPPSPEHYLQEIGRAGRDGRPAKAIALPLVDEFISRHSLAHSDRLSNDQLTNVFFTLQTLVNEAVDDIRTEPGVDLSSNDAHIDDLHIAIPVVRTVDASDCKEESIETMLSLLEEENSSHPSLLSVEGYLPDTATITLKKCSLEKLSKIEEVVRSIEKCSSRVDLPSGSSGGTALEKGFYAYSYGTWQFSVVRCARCMGPTSEPRHVYAALRRLQERGELELSLDVTNSGRALHVRLKKDGVNLFRTKPTGASGDHSECGNTSINGLKSMMMKQFSAKEQVGVEKVQSMYDIIQKVSNVNEEPMEDESVHDEKSARLVEFQSLIQTFFEKGTTVKKEKHVDDVIKDFPLDNVRLLSCLSSDATSIMQLLSSRRQERTCATVQIREHMDYRSLCISKILHGIDAPRAPISTWYSHTLWGKYRSFSFTSILKAVEQVFENN